MLGTVSNVEDTVLTKIKSVLFMKLIFYHRAITAIKFTSEYNFKSVINILKEKKPTKIEYDWDGV